MGVTGHQVLLLIISTLDHNAKKSFETLLNVIDVIQKPETHVSRNLVVPRTASVQLSGQRANNLGKPALIGCVNILVIFLGDELEV